MRTATLRTAQGQFYEVYVTTSYEGLKCRNKNNQLLETFKWATVTMSRGGEEGRGLLLRSGNVELIISDRKLLSQISKEAPEFIQQKIEEAVGAVKKHQRSHLSNLFLRSCFIVLAFGFVLIVLGEIIAYTASIFLPYKVDIALGDIAFEDYLEDHREVTNSDITAPITEIAKQLTQPLVTPYKFRIHVFEDPEINAFAFPGGHIVINSGLLKRATSFDEIAGVLAHEIQHVEKRHSLDNLVRALGISSVIEIFKFSVGVNDGGLTQFVPALVGLSFSRSQEAEADRYGVALAKQAGFRPSGLIDFFDKIKDEENPLLRILSTHPLTQDRIDAVNSLINPNEPFVVQPFKYSWVRFKSAL